MPDQIQDAWAIGVEKFVGSLPLEHQVAFKAPASADECMFLIEKAQSRNRKFDRLVRILQPLVDPLRRFESSVDILVQTNSTFASPVWGPLKVVLTLVGDRLNTLESVAILLERLVMPLKRFQNYELLFKESVPLRCAIGALYASLIEFCTRVVSYYCKTALRKAFTSFDKDIEEMLDKIRHHWSEVDVVANAANIEEAKVARRTEEIQRALEMRRLINLWLSPSNIEDDLHKHLLQYMPQSCTWLLEAPEFQMFLKSTNSYTLKILGRPGSGKSVAASAIVRYLTEESKGAVLYFFCNNSDAEKRMTLNVIRTFLWQLLQYDESLYSIVAPYHHRSGRPSADSEYIIYTMFKAALTSAPNLPIYFVVDAVDECEDFASLLTVLFQAMNSTAVSMKVVFLSRDEPALRPLLASCQTGLFMELNKQLLEDYVCQRLCQMYMFQDPINRLQTAQTISSAADGLWLFARLLLDEIQSAPSPAEIQRMVNTIPTGLIQLYSSIIRSKEARMSDLQIKMAQQLYLWVDTSEYIPEWLWKQTKSDNLEDDMITNLLEFSSSSKKLFSPINIVQDLCHPLVETHVLPLQSICRPGDAYDYSMFEVRFFHQTAKHFLKWSTDASFDQLPVCLRPKRLGHWHRGVTAAWYFSESGDFKHSLESLRERPRSRQFDCYFEMACGLWSCFKLDSIRRDLSLEEQYQLEIMLETMISFVNSERILGFLEASFIIHFSEHSTLFLDNVDAVLKSSCPSNFVNDSTVLARFNRALWTTLIDLAYIVMSLWPKDDLHDLWFDSYGSPPEGFRGRPLAKAMLTLARRYEWLFTAPSALSINCFAISPKG